MLNVEGIPVEIWRRFFCTQRVWKSVKYSTGGCGEKVLENTGPVAVFHITFYYHC
jgi:hypothetical protein